MAQIKTTPNAILTAAVARIIANTIVTGYTASTVFVTDDADWLPPNPGATVCAVMLSGARFDDSMFDGAANESVTADADLIVTIHNPVQLDSPGRSEIILNDATRGTYPKITAILKTLSGHNLVSGSDTILRQPLFPRSWNDPNHASRARGSITLAFGCYFDWDLTT